MSVLLMTEKKSEEAPVMLALWGMQNTSLLLPLPGLHGHGVILPDRILSMGQIELFDHLNVCKQMADV